METTPEPQKHLVKTDAISRTTYEKYVTANPDDSNLMTFREWADREQVQLLRSINSKIGFFVFLAIVSILLSLLDALFSMF